MAWPLRLLVVAVVVTVAVVAVGTYLRTPPRQAAAPPPRPAPPAPVVPLSAPLSSVNTTMMTVQRAPFCDRLAPSDLTAALGGPVRHISSYSAGQRTSVGGVTDVVDEYGCRWSASRRQARAWVFAAAVTPQWAHQLAATAPAGCHALHGLQYGAPSAAFACGDAVRLQGLFGDAWLTCELSADADLAGRFCLAVARAAE